MSCGKWWMSWRRVGRWSSLGILVRLVMTSPDYVEASPLPSSGAKDVGPLRSPDPVGIQHP